MRLAARVTLAGLALAAMLPLSIPARAATGAVTPLFAEEAPIAVTISGPVREIAIQAQHSTDPKPATLVANGETHAIDLSARGISRRKRDACTFPPLMVRFTAKPAAGSLFHRQGRLKLVTHCRETASFAHYVLREYAVYRLFNALTANSLKVRLARVRYENKGKLLDEHWGFFIEDIDDAARRIGGKEVDVAEARLAALDAAAAARYVLFQYLIGNLDWDMLAGPEGTLCCHNSKLVGAAKDATSELIPVPYDFDFSGIVDTPYAGVPEGIPIASLRTRYYRGFCRQNEAVLAALPDVLAARPALEATLRELPVLAEKDTISMLAFLADGYADIATPALVERKLLDNCR
jgi:hypothetical protein